MRRIGLLVALLSVLLLVGLGLLVARALESVENERAIRHEVLAERVFDEMEEALTEITEREEARPFLQYRFFFVPEDQVGANPALSRSPLSHVPEDDWLLGWFQLDPDGGITTPFVPEDTELAGEVGWSEDAELDARVARLTAIAAKLPVKPVDRRPVAETPDLPTRPREEKTVVPESTSRASSVSAAPAPPRAKTKTEAKKPAPQPKQEAKDDVGADELADAGSTGSGGLSTRQSVGSASKSSTSRDPYRIGSLNKGATKRADRQQRVTKSNAENLRSYQFPEDNQALLGNEAELPQVGFEGESGEVVAQVSGSADQWDASSASAGDGLSGDADGKGGLGGDGEDGVADGDGDGGFADGGFADAGGADRDKSAARESVDEFDVDDLDAMAGGEDFADLEEGFEAEDEADGEAVADYRETERVEVASVERRNRGPQYAPQKRKRRLARKDTAGAVPPVFGGSAPAADAEPAPEPEAQPAEAVAGKKQAEEQLAQAAEPVTLQERAAEIAKEELSGATGGQAGSAEAGAAAGQGTGQGTGALSTGAASAGAASAGGRAAGEGGSGGLLGQAKTEKANVADPAPAPPADPAPPQEVEKAPRPVTERTRMERTASAPEPTAATTEPTEPVDEEVNVEISPFRGERVDAQTLVLFRTVRIGDIEYVQGLALLLPQLADWLEEAVLAGSDVKDYLELAWNGGALSRRGPAPDFSFAHTFAEPFTDLAVTSYLSALPEARGSGRAWILQLTAALVIVGLLGLVALWRMISVVVHFAERRNNFVAAVSHELKTPLTAIRMYAEMLRDGYVLSEDKRGEYYETMAAESERLSRLIQNVLELSRLEKGSSAGGDLVTGDVRPVLEEAVRVLERHAKDRGFSIALEVPDDLPAVRYERDGLLQVLINLVDNGIKFSKSSDEKVVVVEAIPRGGGVVLQIRDHGPGVPPRQLGNIFQPFYRGERELTRRTKGTGIGLALVKGIVERMGGNVTARNHPDGGFEVRVALAAA